MHTKNIFDIAEIAFALGVLSYLRRCRKKELEVVNLFKGKSYLEPIAFDIRISTNLIITSTFKVADKTVV